MSASAPLDPAARRRGSEYLVLPEDLETFRREGWVHLPGVLSDEELRPLEATYMAFLRREIPVPGKDYCDMSGDYRRSIEDYDVLNIMLPSRYHSDWRGNLYEQRAASIARQIQGEGRPRLRPAPRETPGQARGGLRLAPGFGLLAGDPGPAHGDGVDGPRRFAARQRLHALRQPGSHREPRLRAHRPLHGDREKSHTLVAEVDEAADRVEYAEIRRGDVTVHDERVAHGSGGNPSARWRRAYIVAFRSHATIAAERAMGFTHSHNDPVEVLEAVGYAAAEKRAR